MWTGGREAGRETSEPIPRHPEPPQAAVRAEHLGQAHDEGQAPAALVKRSPLRRYRRR